MSYIQYLKINDVNLPLPTSYSIELNDVEADSSGETEGGTTQRDVIRSGVIKIQVTFQVTAKWLKALSLLRSEPILKVQYFDINTLSYKITNMFIDGFKSNLQKDTSYNGLWVVSFTLNEY